MSTKEKRTAQRVQTPEALQAAGQVGLPADWFDDHKIKRGAARIHDLKELGFSIDGKYVSGTYRYFLRENNQMELEGLPHE